LFQSIRKVFAREILDSRGNPTIEVEIRTADASTIEKVPSGASTGIHEALELRDGNKKRYNGKGCKKAVNNVNKKIAKKITGRDCKKQSELDKVMIDLDGTPNKSKFGANAILGVSLAIARLGAIVQKKPLYSALGSKKILPIPFLNVINGGKHAQNKLDIQEFMIVPLGRNYKESLRMGTEVYHKLKELITKRYGKSSVNVGDEGGFAPKLRKTEDALKLLVKAIERCGYSKRIKIAMDCAASEFYDAKKKRYKLDGKRFNSWQLLKFYEKLVNKYPIISIEDSFDEEAFEDFALLNHRLNKHGKKVQIVGDDLTVTNVERIKTALKYKSCNCLLLKVNQIGTVTEAIEAAKLAMKNGWKVMVSHRSGETTSSFIADLAVGLGTGQIKSGAPCRGERLAKYNRLLEIEEELGKKAKFNRSILH